MNTSVLPWFAALVVAAAPAYLVRFSIAGIPTTALELLIYLFVVTVILMQWGRFRPVPRSTTWPVLLFLAAAIISTVIAPDKRAALGILKAWIFDPILFAWALYQVPDRAKLMNALQTGLTAGGLFVALAAIFQRLTGQVTVDGRVIGPYAWSPVENASPNYLALYVGPLAVLTFGLALDGLAKRQQRLRSWFFTVSFTAMVAAIFFSYSRGGLAAVGVGVLAMLVLHFWSWIQKGTLAKLMLLGLITVGLFSGYYYIRPNPSLSPEEGGRITASNNVRWEIWKTTVQEVIPASPILGIGLGNFQSYFTELTRGRVNYDRIAPLALTPHNLFLALWVNLGLLGVVSFVWLTIAVIRRSWRKTSDWVVASLLGAFVALLAHGLLDTPYFKNDLSLLFWTTIALLLLLTENKAKEETR